MKSIIALILGTVLITACSDATSANTETTSKTEKETAVVVNANRVLTMEVTGMSCEMACGGSIREGLIETKAVARVQFENFDMEQTTNSAKVYFDDSKISADKIVEIVTQLNNKQFTVGETSLDEFTEITSCVKESSSCSRTISQPLVEVESSSFQLPNLVDLLRSVIL